MSGQDFELGHIVATPGALELVGPAGVYALLGRHASGDWGELEAFDRRENERARREGLRIFSAYATPRGRVWIITEGDRSTTTVLLPEDY